MTVLNDDLLRMTVDITVAAVSGAGDKAPFLLNEADKVADFMQVVYDKLDSLNKES